MRSIQLTKAWLAAFVCAALLAACGGGGDDAPAPVPTPEVPAQPEPPVVVLPENEAPIASILAVDEMVLVQQPLVLNGAASSDPEGAALHYQWTIDTRPAASKATISNPDAAEAALVPDVAGHYVVQLIVSDGAADSQPQTVEFVAATPVQGTIAADAAWTLAQSPIVFTDGVSIEFGSALTVEAGVEIHGQGHDLLVHGSWIVDGALGKEVRISDLHVVRESTWFFFSDDDLLDFPHRIQIRHAEIQGGSLGRDSRLFVMGAGSYVFVGSWELVDSRLTDVEEPLMIDLASKTPDTVIARNVFVRSGGVHFGIGYGLLEYGVPSIRIQNNVFMDWSVNASNEAAAIVFRTHAELPTYYDVSHNSFLSTNRLAVSIQSATSNAPVALLANNYWGTTEQAVIESMLAYTRDSVPYLKDLVQYQPYLLAPHPDTPVP